MKPYERRAQGLYPYFILAEWSPQLACYQDGKHAFMLESDAMQNAKEKPGQYRVSKVTEICRIDLKPFVIA